MGISRWPIVGFVGPNGAGKTLCMVETMARPAMAAGLPILANFALPDYPGWIPATSWGQVLSFTSERMGFRSGLVLLDEASAWVPSRESSKMPAAVLAHLNQLRKANVEVGWTGPAWSRCDKGLREVTQAVVWCRGYLADPLARDSSQRHRFPFSGPALRDDSGRKQRVDGWANRRLMRWRWYDPFDFPPDLEGQALERPPAGVKAKAGRWYWRPNGVGQGLYDTSQAVLALSNLDDSGSCVDCGGQRARRKCTCDEHNQAQLVRTANTLVTAPRLPVGAGLGGLL